MQAYAEKSRESDTHSLPDIEVFHIPMDYQPEVEGDDPPYEEGYYWWGCLPGCLPDSEPVGPFDTPKQAIDNAQEWAEV